MPKWLTLRGGLAKAAHTLILLAVSLLLQRRMLAVVDVARLVLVDRHNVVGAERRLGRNVSFWLRRLDGADMAARLSDVRFTANRWGNRPAFLWITEYLGCSASG